MKMSRLFTLLLALMLALPIGAATAQEEITLTMWTWKVFHLPGLEAIGEAFTAETGIKVNFEFYGPDADYRSRIQTASQAGDMPDMIAYWSGGQWEMAANGLLVELTDFVDEEWAGTFLPGTYESTSVWTQTSYDNCQANAECLTPNLEVGQVFSVPMLGGSATFIFANKSMLEEAGLDPTVIPANTEEFLEMMTTVYEATGKGITYGGKFQDLLTGWVVNPIAVTSCGPAHYTGVLNGEEGFSFHDECVANSFKFIGDITERGLWQPGVLQLLIDEADVAFSQGQAAFLVAGSYTLGFLISQGMDPENIIIFTQPTLPDAIQNPIELAPFALIDVMVTKDSEHPEEAKQFIKFMTQPDQMATFAKITGDFPAATISGDPEVVGAVMASLVKSYANAAESLLASPEYRGAVLITSSDTWDTIHAIVNKQITGEDTLENLLDAADEAVRYDRSLREG